MKLSSSAFAALTMVLLAACNQNSGSNTGVTLDTTPPDQIVIQEVLVLTEAADATTSVNTVQQMQAFAGAIRASGSTLSATAVTPTDLPAGYVVKYAVRYVAPTATDVAANSIAAYFGGTKLEAAPQRLAVPNGNGGTDLYAVVTTPLTQSGVTGSVGLTVLDTAGNESVAGSVAAVAALAPSAELVAGSNKSLSYGAVDGAAMYSVGIFENLAEASTFSVGDSQLWSKSDTTALSVSYADGDAALNLGQVPQAWAVLASSGDLKAFSITAKNF